MSIFSSLKQDKTFHQPVNWGVTAIMIALHLCALASIFFFTWKALIVCIVMWWVAGSLGIGMGYHRLLTHRGYKTPKWMEYFLTTCGTLALEGGPIAWVATHRIHHQNTDKEGDPHSPRDGGIWAHMGWILTGRAMHQRPYRTSSVRARPSQRQVSSLDQQVACGSFGDRRHSVLCHWRLALGFLGRLSAHR